MIHISSTVKSGIRDACIEDIPLLTAIETTSFDGDRISHRSFRHLIRSAQCRILVDCVRDQIRGYIVVLFRRGTQCARIYSIATHPEFLRRGVAKRLVRGAQLAACERGCAELRLEIRQDNAVSLHMFRETGYLIFGHYHQYYEDGMDALRFTKVLHEPNAEQFRYKRNQLDSTCNLPE